MSKRTDVYYWNAGTSAWVGPEANQVKVRIDDSFLCPKFAEITIADFDQAIQNSGVYSAYKRIKIVENVANKVIFFGRIEFVDVQNSDGGTFLILQCKDFLQELECGIINYDFSGPLNLGSLIKDIIDYSVYTEITYKTLAGVFTISNHDNAGYWIRVGSAPPYGIARLIHDDTSSKTLVITDVIQAEAFIDEASIAEYSDANCITDTGVTANQDGAFVHNIDTSSIGTSGAIDAETTSNYLKSSQSPLQAITSLCLDASSDGIFSFYLSEGSGASLYPPVFTFFAKETLPAGGASANGLTIKLNGTNGNQQREMQVDYSFPQPQKEIYTEAKAISSDSDNNQFSSVKKSGSTAFSLKTFKQRTYQALEHSNQAGLNTSVDNVMAVLGAPGIQRAQVTFPYYPYFYINPNYTVVRAGDLVHIHNSRISYASAGIDMVVTKVEYEEPNSTTRMSLKQSGYGIGAAEYEYPNSTIGTYFPDPVDVRIPTWSGFSDIIPLAIQGYQTTIAFTRNVVSPNDTVDWTGSSGGEIKFYDGTLKDITSGSYQCLDGNIYYIYFDLADASPTTLKTTTSYKSVMNQSTGLLCLVQKNTTAGAGINIIPSYGKEPLISTDFIDMSGLVAYNFGSDKYLSAIYSTQILAGNLRLTSDTVKYDSDNTHPWYSSTGIVLSADHGISIYGGTSILGLRTFADVATYNTYVAANDWDSTTGVQCFVGTDGKLFAGGGSVRLDSAGIKLYTSGPTGGTQRGQILSDGSGWFGTSTAFVWSAAGAVTATGITLRTGSTAAKVEIDSTGIKGYNSSAAKTMEFLSTGAGSVGVSGSTMSWNTAGAVTISNLNASNITTGTLGVAYLGSGTYSNTITLTGNIQSGASGTNRIFIGNDATIGVCIAGINNSNVGQFYLKASDGKAYCGAGSVILDSTGIVIDKASSTALLLFKDGATTYGSAFYAGAGGMYFRSAFENTPLRLYSVGTGKIYIGGGGDAEMEVTLASQSIFPKTTNTYACGSSSLRWLSGYFGSLDTGSILPMATSTYVLGNSSYRWASARIEQITAAGWIKPDSGNSNPMGDTSLYWSSVYANKYYGKSTTIDSF